MRIQLEVRSAAVGGTLAVSCGPPSYGFSGEAGASASSGGISLAHPPWAPSWKDSQRVPPPGLNPATIAHDVARLPLESSRQQRRLDAEEELRAYMASVSYAAGAQSFPCQRCGRALPVPPHPGAFAACDACLMLPPAV